MENYDVKKDRRDLYGAREGRFEVVDVPSLVPPIPRFVMLHLLGGAYRRTRRACWSGTPAADIDSTPLTRGR